MIQNWTLGQKLSVGFFVVLAMTLITAAISIGALRLAIRSKDDVIDRRGHIMVDAQRMHTYGLEASDEIRGALLTGRAGFGAALTTTRENAQRTLTELDALVKSTPGRALLAKVDRSFRDYLDLSDRVMNSMGATGGSAAERKVFDETVLPRFHELDSLLQSFVNQQERFLEEATKDASDTAGYSMSLIVVTAIISILLGIAAATYIKRDVSIRIAAAVQGVQSSSSELQAAANQQTSGFREQVSSVSEISTTVKELVATARQIAESAQRVAHIASDTATAAASGDTTVRRAEEAMESIKGQIETLVGHMVELGKRSQEVGGILEVVNELSEQTNILAINASIEAAGAGESGKRFAVVADEIRKLADRVGSSTKEIRALMEGMRLTVNTAVMATEVGAKAVEAGSRQFDEVTTSFHRIASLVSTTTEASREIELSTKQQTTAVEQVNIAIANVGQAARESESAASQTLQTASELVLLSKRLSSIVQTQGTA